MQNTIRLNFCILNLVLLSAACAGESSPKVAAAPKVNEEDLQRVARVPVKILPWRVNPVPVAPLPEGAKDPNVPLDSGPLPDLSAGDLVIKAGGEFKREATADRETLTLNTDVEIESIVSKSVLRAQQVRVERDLKTGRTLELHASGGVQLVTPDRRARGETLKYEVKYYPQGQEQRATYTIEGNRGRGVKATLWVGNDAIEAEKFISDVDTFRAQGFPAAVFVLPSKAGEAPPSAAKENNAGVGLLPGLGFSGGSKVRIQADGELQFEIPLGRVRINRNVVIQQEGVSGMPGMKMAADEVLIHLSPPEAGETATGVFSGSLKSLEAIGRVEIKAHPRSILCDKSIIDMQRNRLSMEMKNPKEDVRIYILETAAGGKVILTPKSLLVNMESGEIQAAGAQRMENFSGTAPSNRIAPIPVTPVTPVTPVPKPPAK